MICSKKGFLHLFPNPPNHITQKDSRPSYVQFLHSRPGYTVLAQQLVSVNAPAYRPRYAVFGGQFMP